MAPARTEHGLHEILLIHDLLDTLIVDLERRGPARVNDVLLERHDGDLRLKAVDRSGWAIVRRLTRGRWPAPSQADLTDWRYVAFLRGDPDRRADDATCGRIARLPPGEIARLSTALPYLHAAELIGLLPDHAAAEVFSVLAPERQIQVFEELGEEQASNLLARLAPDGATDLLARLESGLARRHLDRLPEARRRLVLDLLQYPEHTVGGIMTNDVVLLPEHATVGEASRRLHECLSTPAFVYYVYIVDDLESRHLRGMVTLRELLTADADASLHDVMNPYLTALAPLDPARQACNEVIDHRVQALPVVGDAGRILGAVTADAALAQIAPASWRARTRNVFS